MYGVRSSKPCNPFQEYTFSSELKWTRKFWVVVTWFRKESYMHDSLTNNSFWKHNHDSRMNAFSFVTYTPNNYSRTVRETFLKLNWRFTKIWQDILKKPGPKGNTRNFQTWKVSPANVLSFKKQHSKSLEKPKLQSPTTLGRNLLSYLLNITVGKQYDNNIVHSTKNDYSDSDGATLSGIQP